MSVRISGTVAFVSECTAKCLKSTLILGDPIIHEGQGVMEELGQGRRWMQQPVFACVPYFVLCNSSPLALLEGLACSGKTFPAGF